MRELEIRSFFETWGSLNGVFQGVYTADWIPEPTPIHVNEELYRVRRDLPAYYNYTNLFDGDGRHRMAIYLENDILKFGFDVPARKLAAFIVNTDVLGGKGKHWVVIFLENDHLEFFDSFGRSPEDCGSIHISYFAKKYPNRIHNRYAFQSVGSYCCGFYCIYFIFQRFIGSDWDYTLQNLWKQTNRDKYVVDFVEKMIFKNLLLKEILKKCCPTT